MHRTSSASEAVRDGAVVQASRKLLYCQPPRSLLVKTKIVEKAVQWKPLSRHSLGLSVAVDFVVVGITTGMPPHRVFRHTWRDSTCSVHEIGFSCVGSS
jgi:hypothetical protein